jgi:hypothetical protein
MNSRVVREYQSQSRSVKQKEWRERRDRCVAESQEEILLGGVSYDRERAQGGAKESQEVNICKLIEDISL